MKLWAVASKPTYWGGFSLCGNAFTYTPAFFRKKDAKRFVERYYSSLDFEVVTLEVANGKRKKSNRKR
jgi:hypothetical protein